MNEAKFIKRIGDELMELGLEPRSNYFDLEDAIEVVLELLKEKTDSASMWAKKFMEASNQRAELQRKLSQPPPLPNDWKEEFHKLTSKLWIPHEDARKLIDWIENDLLASSNNGKGCGVCGSQTVYIRGRYPKQDKRLVCPCCSYERLKQIDEISSPNYGKTYKNERDSTSSEAT